MVDGAFKNTHLMAQQVAALGLQVQQLANDVRSIRQDMPVVLTQCAIAIVGNPDVWAAARKAMASQARDTAGGWLLGLLTKPVNVVIGLFLLYQFGGWHAVVAWFKSHAGG